MPEILVKIVMEIHCVSRDEAEELLSAEPPDNYDDDWYVHCTHNVHITLSPADDWYVHCTHNVHVTVSSGGQKYMSIIIILHLYSAYCRKKNIGTAAKIKNKKLL